MLEHLAAQSETRVIVGILGRTFHPSHDEQQYRQLDSKSRDVLAKAEQLATTITRLQHIVLTGGTLLRPEISVKFRALRAAQQQGTAGAIARIVGILPDGISDALNVGEVMNERITSARSVELYLHTRMTGPERDKVTGMSADVFIALKGKHGTPREVAAALIAGHSVVFLDSLDELQKPTEDKLTEQGYAGTFPSKPLVAQTVDSAVTQALEIIGVNSAHPQFTGSLRRATTTSWPGVLNNEVRVLARLHDDVQLLLA